MKQAKKHKRIGNRPIAEFSELRNAIRANRPVNEHFTVKIVRLDQRRSGTPKLSNRLGVQ